MRRFGSVLQAVLLTLIVASVVLLSLRVTRLERALKGHLGTAATASASSPKPGMHISGLRGIGPDGTEQEIDLSGRKLLFVYSVSCPYSRQMFPVWQKIAEGDVPTIYVSVGPAHNTDTISSTPASVFTLPLSTRNRFTSVPQTIVVDNGRVVFLRTGVLSLESALKLLQ